MFTALCEVLAGKTAFPGLAVVAGLLGDPALRITFADAIVAPRLKTIESILRRAEQTSEIPRGTLTPLAAHAGPALILHIFLLTGAPPTPVEVNRILDTVLPPRRWN